MSATTAIINLCFAGVVFVGEVVWAVVLVRSYRRDKGRGKSPRRATE